MTSTFDSILLRVDEFPGAAVFRAVLGYLVVPAWSALIDQSGRQWTLIPFFLGVLLAVRVVPVVLRRILPFSATVRQTWAERRQLTKRFDSYQWQKLLWIGLGLIAYMLVSGRPFASLILLTSFCLVAGASGLWIWRRGVPARKPPHSQ
jgi:hypothetical protein